MKVKINPGQTKKPFTLRKYKSRMFEFQARTPISFDTL
jgi:hypothetical protein